MATLIKKFFGNKKTEQRISKGWAEPKEQKEFERTLESWRQGPMGFMVQ